MTVQNITSCCVKRLIGVCNVYKDALLEAEILICCVLNVSRVSLITMQRVILNEQQIESIFRLCDRRVLYEPLAYITGVKNFYGVDFCVDKNVLIPRPETEELVELASLHIQDTDHICDVGTGSGVIAITLARLFPNANITAIDISEDALNIAKKNASRILNNCDRINFVCADALSYTPQNKFNVVIANAPYVGFSERASLARELSYEPGIALFAGDFGFDFYTEFIANLKNYCKTDAKFFFEIGYKQAADLLKICKHFGIENAIAIKDSSDKMRFLSNSVTYAK